MNKVHFTNEEDAIRHSKNFGGEVIDNRHSAKGWNNNNFTVVQKNSKSPVNQPQLSHPYGHVSMTRQQHEQWMDSKGWNESTKQMHRNDFTGDLEFDGEGGFYYV